MKNKNKQLMIFLYIHNHQENNINFYQSLLYKILSLSYVLYLIKIGSSSWWQKYLVTFCDFNI